MKRGYNMNKANFQKIVGVTFVFCIVAMVCFIILFCKKSLQSLNSSADKAYSHTLQTAKYGLHDYQQKRQICLDHKNSYDIITYKGKPYIYFTDNSTDRRNRNKLSISILVNTQDVTFINNKKYSRIETNTTAGAKPNGMRTRNNEYVVLAKNKDTIYLVKKGDTLSAVSNVVHYSVDEIASYNGIENKDLIYTGESLRIPGK